MHYTVVPLLPSPHRAGMRRGRHRRRGLRLSRRCGVKKRKAREQAEREQNRLVRSSRRSRLEDSSKSKAMDELKAKRSAGMVNITSLPFQCQLYIV